MAAKKSKSVSSSSAKPETRLFKLRELVGKSTFAKANSAKAKAIKAVIEKRILENLSGKAKPPFKPLSPRYKAWKEKNYGKLPILVLTGRSKKTYKVTPTNEGGRGSRSALKIKVKVPSYFWYHHTGTKYLPKRDWLALQPKDKREIKRIIEDKTRVLAGSKLKKTVKSKSG